MRFRYLAVFLAAVAMPVAAPIWAPGGAAMAAPVTAAFTQWRDGFRRRALSQGIRADVFDRAFAGVGINERVLELDGRQTEFTRTFGEYLDITVPDDRVALGRRKVRPLEQTLAAIERRFGVDRKVVAAIWGVETNFGGFMGGTKTVEALATLAYEGRRRSWAERELIAVLELFQSGETRNMEIEGSWAGAMGHTQFMPTSYQAYAVDFTGDGRRDVWAKDPTDALASAANYLRVHGWKAGQPWGQEVRLPAGFDVSLADLRPGRPISYWMGKGVRAMDGSLVPNHGDAGLWLPMGASGPAFLIWPNFFVIKRYNNANTYALAVGHLGDRIYGGPKIQAKWPTGERPLTRSETRELQRRLTARGFDTQGVDGLIGPNSIAAIRAAQRRFGMTPDGNPTRALLNRLK